MSTESKGHSSTPFCRKLHNGRNLILSDTDEWTVGAVYSDGDAEFIVRACNAHDDLLAAAQWFVNLVDSLARLGLLHQLEDPNAVAHLQDQARTAIAKAKGEVSQ